ncbi:MAG: hypothetical protein FWD64_02050 [Acidobacteriaceae bacterium]|nr:hypothetical protein [Acidobacteriaceae bacterium]
MTLLNAPEYNERKERRKVGLLIGAGVLIVLAILVGMGGFIKGHGWFFSNLPVERRVDKFFQALESKDFERAYAIYWNDKNWKQHPQKYDYSLARFTEDWTAESPAGGPIRSHRVDVSKTAGDGTFGSTIIIGVTVNGDKRLFMGYVRKDGTLFYPSTYQIQY